MKSCTFTKFDVLFPSIVHGSHWLVSFFFCIDQSWRLPQSFNIELVARGNVGLSLCPKEVRGGREYRGKRRVCKIPKNFNKTSKPTEVEGGQGCFELRTRMPPQRSLFMFMTFIHTDGAVFPSKGETSGGKGWNQRCSSFSVGGSKMILIIMITMIRSPLWVMITTKRWRDVWKTSPIWPTIQRFKLRFHLLQGTQIIIIIIIRLCQDNAWGAAPRCTHIHGRPGNFTFLHYRLRLKSCLFLRPEGGCKFDKSGIFLWNMIFFL